MMGHPSRVPHVYCQCGNFVPSLGNLGQGGKTGETKAPIAKWQRINAIVSFVVHVGRWWPLSLLGGSPAGLQGGSPRREPSNPQASALDCMMTRPNTLGVYNKVRRPVPGGSFLAKHQTSKHRREGQGKEPRSLGKGCLRMILFKH